MLTLAQASGYFDRTPIQDADTGVVLFLGQIDPYSDAARDSGTAYRRILSVKPGTAMPTSRVVQVFGARWLIGNSEIDGLSEAHREKYVLHPATYALTICRLGGYLTSTASLLTWGELTWFKDGKEETVSSRAVPMYTLYASRSADIREFDVVKMGTQGFLVTKPHTLPSGTLSATCHELEHAPASATLNTRVYDPVAGKHTSTTASTKLCLRVRYQSLYQFDTQASARYQEGDSSLVLPAGTAVTTKDTITLAGSTWSVIAVDNIGGAVVAHGRPA